MKIISGKYRGKNLKTLDGMETRPTTSRVKESIFNIIQFDLQDACVLDLFSGSGQMGIEAISRGAKFCDFNDNNGKATQIISENLQAIDADYKISSQNYQEFLKTTDKKYDIIFLDPPYHKKIINDVLILIKDFQLLEKCGIIVAESCITDELCFENTGFKPDKTYKYGSILITKIKEA